MDTKNIAIARVIKANGGEYRQLELREYTLSEFLRVIGQAGETAQWSKIISSVSGWPDQAVDQLGARDLEEAKAFLQGFSRQAQDFGAWSEEPRTVHLDAAVQFGGTDYAALDLREYTVGEKRRAETHSGEHKQWAQVIAAVSGWPLPAVEKLPITKYWEARWYLEGFTLAGRATGES